LAERVISSLANESLQIVFDVAFDAMIARAEPLAFGDGLTVRVVTTADLIAMKGW